MQEARTKIGPFTLTKKLGEGVHGSAYLAKQGRQKALKVIKILHRSENDPAKLPAGRLEALQEQVERVSFEHPNFVSPITSGLTEWEDPISGEPCEVLYIANENIEGPDLYRFTARAAWSSILEVIVSLLRGLEAVHARGLRHGHLSASNVIVFGVGPRKSARLLDCGLALEIAETRRLAARTSFAPEVLRGESGDRRSDLYDLGCLLFECATRSPVFSGDEDALITAHLTEEPRKARTLKRSVPVAVEKLIDALLSKDPADRPASANAVIRELNRTANKRFSTETRDVRLASLLTPRFGGRDAELDDLFSCVPGGESSDPGPSVVVVSSDMGQGRTRLLSELRKRVERERPQAAWVSPSKANAASLLNAISDVELPGDDPEPLAAEAAFLRRLIPGLPEAFARPAPPIASPRERQRLAEATARVILGACRRRPLVIAIDDVQEAQTLLIDALRLVALDLHAARSRPESDDDDPLLAPPADGQLLIVLSSAQDELYGRPAEGALKELLAQPGVRQLSLDGLESETLLQTLASALGREAGEVRDIVRRVADATDGNLAHSMALLSELAEVDAISPPDGAWSIEEEAAATPLTTSSASKILSRRTEGLNELERRLLAALALSGGRGEAVLLSETLAVSPPEILGAARSLERLGLLCALGLPPSPAFALSGVSVVEATLPGVDSDLAKELHDALGQAAGRAAIAEGIHRQVAAEFASSAAHHLLHGTKPAQGVPFTLFAARSYVAAAQPERAIDLIDPALRVLEEDADPGALPEALRVAMGGDPQVTAHLLSAEAHLDMGRPSAARSAAQRAFAAARTARLPRQMVRSLLLTSRASCELGDPAQAKSSAEEAVSLARGDEWTRGLGLALHARGVAERVAQDRDEALASLEEARNVFSERGDHGDLAAVNLDVAGLRAAQGDSIGALDALDRALELDEEAERAGVQVRTQLLRARLQRNAGELDRSFSTAERATQQAIGALDVIATAEGLECLAEVLQAKGELGPARRREQVALSLRERVGDVSGAALARLRLGRLLCDSGHLPEAEASLNLASQTLKQAGDHANLAQVVVSLAAVHLASGDLSRARDAVDRALDESKAAGGGPTACEAQAIRARLALIQGDLARAEELAASTAEEAARLALSRVECAARITLGLAQLCRGRPVEADRELRDAFDLARDRGEWSLVARARLCVARVHLIRGEPAGALSEVGKARDLAAKLEDSLLEVEWLLALARLHLFLGQAKRAGALLEMAAGRVEERKLGLPAPTVKLLRAVVCLENARAGSDGNGTSAGKAQDRAEELLDAAEREATSSARRGLRAEIDVTRADLRMLQGDAAGARERAEAALEASKITGNQLTAVRAERMIAYARRQQGRFEDALASAERALQAAESIRDGEARAASLLERGRARAKLGQTLLAAHDLREATSHLRGIWASLPEDLRADYQAKPLAGAIIAAATEITSAAEEAKSTVSEPPPSAPSPAPAPAGPSDAAPLAHPEASAPGEGDASTLRDPLTNLYNHTFFTAQLETEIKRAQRHSRPLSLLKINIDRFKLVRELYGPKTAKKIIRDVAGLLLRHVRDVDIVARYFGDEFELLLPDTDQRGALLTSERIREATEAHRFEHDDEKIELTLTIGVAAFPRDAKDRDALICRVDEALYNARNRGSNSVFSFGGDEEVPVEETSAELRELDALMLTREGRTILSMVQRLVNQELDMDRVIELVTGMIVEATRGERGFILLKGPTGEFTFRHGRNIDDKVIGSPELKISNGIARETARTGTPVHVSEALDDARFRDFKSVMDLNLRSIICAPIKVGDDILGVIYVDHNQVARNFNDEDLNFLVAIANKVAIPIKNSKKLRETEDRLAAAEARLKSQAADLQTKYSYDSIIGRSEPMQRVFKLLDRIVETNHSVVIHGESGTGKELIARAIHYNGPRKSRPFVAENCAALSDTLLEAELFGHVKGAFTGADRDSKGLFELANGGTLFLDEIGDMSERMQKKLLRVLQEGEVRPVGGKRVFHVDVRIVSASNKDLKKLVQERKFREDLYYRLNVITVNLPPLRERRDDVVLLTEFFLKQHLGAGADRNIERETLGYMMNYDWPGNVRELENEVNRLVAMSDDKISPDLLSSKIREGAKVQSKGTDGLSKYYNRSLKEVEHEFMREIILHTLEDTNWHRTKAAKILKVPTSTLFNKMKKYGIG